MFSPQSILTLRLSNCRWFFGFLVPLGYFWDDTWLQQIVGQVMYIDNFHLPISVLNRFLRGIKGTLYHFWALTDHFFILDQKQVWSLLMHTEKFHFLRFALNQFLHEVLACVENFYRLMTGPTERRTKWDVKAHGRRWILFRSLKIHSRI